MGDDLISTFRISAAGMKVQGSRLRVISQNIANADSLPTEPGKKPYQRKLITFKNEVNRELGVNLVEVNRISKDRSDFVKRLDPSHPAADKDGYVLAPNVNKLVEMTPNVKFDLYGINNIQPIWADSFLKAISNSKMGVNLSRGNPIKYYSSDRITQLIGNGLLTFIHEDTHYNNFFSNKEVIFYNNISSLSAQIQKFAKDDFLRKKIAKKGKEKYMKYFNSTVIADYIINNTFSLNYKKSKYLWENI